MSCSRRDETEQVRFRSLHLHRNSCQLSIQQRSLNFVHVSAIEPAFRASRNRDLQRIWFRTFRGRFLRPTKRRNRSSSLHMTPAGVCSRCSNPFSVLELARIACSGRCFEKKRQKKLFSCLGFGGDPSENAPHICHQGGYVHFPTPSKASA